MSDTPRTDAYLDRTRLLHEMEDFARALERELGAQVRYAQELTAALLEKQERIAAQAKEIERLREDAKRYRWLRENAQLGNKEEPEKGPFIKMWWPDVPQNMNGYVWRAPTGEKLDARIDAAIDKEQGQCRALGDDQ